MYTIVIVDDSALFRREVVLTMPWEELNCTIVGLAEDGLPGLNMIKDLKPDIVITDVKMIKMDGIKMIKELKKIGCKSRFIVVSAYSEFDYAVEALKMQADDYILKPISDDLLKQAILKSIKNIKQETISNVHTSDNEIIESFYKKYYHYESLLNDVNTYVANAVIFIKDNYHLDDISIGKVADNLEISESYLVKLFRQELNITFLDYLTQYRMFLSLRYLEDYKNTIYEVAEKLGYSDYRYFTKVFNKTFGINPSEYKNKYSGGN